MEHGYPWIHVRCIHRHGCCPRNRVQYGNCVCSYLIAGTGCHEHDYWPSPVVLHQRVCHSWFWVRCSRLGLLSPSLPVLNSSLVTQCLPRWLHSSTRSAGRRSCSLWVLVYVGNFIGSIVWAYIMANGPFVSFDAAGVATITAFGTTGDCHCRSKDRRMSA